MSRGGVLDVLGVGIEKAFWVSWVGVGIEEFLVS